MLMKGDRVVLLVTRRVVELGTARIEEKAYLDRIDSIRKGRARLLYSSQKGYRFDVKTGLPAGPEDEERRERIVELEDWS